MKHIIIAIVLTLFSCAKDEALLDPIGAFFVSSEKEGFVVVIEENNKRETIHFKGTTFLREVSVKDGSKYYLSGKANDNNQGIQILMYRGKYLIEDVYKYGGRELVKVEGRFKNENK